MKKGKKKKKREGKEKRKDKPPQLLGKNILGGIFCFFFFSHINAVNSFDVRPSFPVFV